MYKRQRDAGIGTYILFQETYNKTAYEALHPTGPQSDYAYHTEAMDRAMEGGIDDVGIGVLFGLNTYRYDFTGLLMHAEHLEARFGVGPHTISVPRICPADDIDTKDFQWRSNFVFSLNRNKVVEMDTETGSLPYSLQVGSDTQTVTNSVAGKPIAQFWGYKVIGRFDEPTDFYYTDANGAVKEVARPINQGIAQGETWLGDYIFADINNDGKIDNNDQTFIGNPEPKFTYGIGNTFSWNCLLYTSPSPRDCS